MQNVEIKSHDFDEKWHFQKNKKSELLTKAKNVRWKEKLLN